MCVWRAVILGKRDGDEVVVAVGCVPTQVEMRWEGFDGGDG